MTKAEKEDLEMKALMLTGMATVYAQYQDWKKLEAAILKTLTEVVERHSR